MTTFFFLSFFSSSSQREYGNAKLERTKAEQERARKEEELQRLKEIALKEQDELHEKRSQKLVEDFIRMKSLTVRRKTKTKTIILSVFLSDSSKTFFGLAQRRSRTSITNGSSLGVGRLEIIISVNFFTFLRFVVDV